MEDCIDDGGSELWIQRGAAHEQAEGDRSEEKVERKITVERNREVSSGNATVKERNACWRTGACKDQNNSAKARLRCASAVSAGISCASSGELRVWIRSVRNRARSCWVSPVSGEGDGQYQSAQRIEHKWRLRGPPAIQRGSTDASPFRHLR